ncbi:MAG: hypothetical protein LDL56_10270 [Armatimonadetes bacterium]|jgi:hypothetical protein|nr:hypothetical protein [Armatimonadota bacterium]MCA1997599.1 hypothetical protein [Armatimonadota bacterium]
MVHPPADPLRALAWLLLAVGVAVGCGPQPKEVPIVAQQPTLSAEEMPNPLPPTRLGLWRDGRKVRPGDTVEDAMDVFPRPRNAAVFYDPPSVFGKDFRAKGWDSGREGFGVIATRGQVVLALRVEYDVAAERPMELVDQYTAEHGLPTSTVEEGKTSYWFWDRAPYRLAVCRTQDAEGNVALVSGVGVIPAMEAIGLGPAVAAADLAIARNLLSEQPTSASAP